MGSCLSRDTVVTNNSPTEAHNVIDIHKALGNAAVDKRVTLRHVEVPTKKQTPITNKVDWGKNLKPVPQQKPEIELKMTAMQVNLEAIQVRNSLRKSGRMPALLQEPVNPMAEEDGNLVPMSTETTLLPPEPPTVPTAEEASALVASPKSVADTEGAAATEDKEALVIVNGGWMISAGYAGDDAPKAVFAAVVGRPKHSPGAHVEVVGDKACAQPRNFILSRPFSQVLETSWSDREDIWHHTFSRWVLNPQNTLCF